MAVFKITISRRVRNRTNIPRLHGSDGEQHKNSNQHISGFTRPRDYVSAADGSFMRLTFLLDLGSSVMRLLLPRLLHSKRVHRLLSFLLWEKRFNITNLVLQYLGTWLRNMIGLDSHEYLIELSIPFLHFSFSILSFCIFHFMNNIPKLHAFSVTSDWPYLLGYNIFLIHYEYIISFSGWYRIWRRAAISTL